MANIGAGETYNAYFIKKENVTAVESMIGETAPIEEILVYNYLQPFRYRFLTTTEMTYVPISNHLKGKFDAVIFTSEVPFTAKERDKIWFVDGALVDKILTITRKTPQIHIGMFAISKKYPHMVELG